ncbi:unnamed protein product [Lactuca virosa]|uniref:Aconitase/3-isopropylmalate dehydratase large subunit alpha/beta/alpha domain-containing protein n=1 Tax=Lactuca virosa TaxID=75947 RepID=A0AAU9PES3_9ASTR|nr:unnamed protein product [Lactuca virosa]
MCMCSPTSHPDYVGKLFDEMPGDEFWSELKAIRWYPVSVDPPLTGLPWLVPDNTYFKSLVMCFLVYDYLCNLLWTWEWSGPKGEITTTKEEPALSLDTTKGNPNVLPKDLKLVLVVYLCKLVLSVFMQGKASSMVAVALGPNPGWELSGVGVKLVGNTVWSTPFHQFLILGKNSLAPGSGVVTKYLLQSGLQKYLDQQGFSIVGYGCTICTVLSGNRNFEGRVHPLTRANYLASPPLVVAYALAGTICVKLLFYPQRNTQHKFISCFACCVF